MKNKVSKINNLLEFPREIVSDIPKFTVLGFDEMLIENYKNILEYEENYIKINTSIGAINITGINLKLGQMTQVDIKIIGNIDSIEFESIVDVE